MKKFVFLLFLLVLSSCKEKEFELFTFPDSFSIDGFVYSKVVIPGTRYYLTECPNNINIDLVKFDTDVKSAMFNKIKKKFSTSSISIIGRSVKDIVIIDDYALSLEDRDKPKTKKEVLKVLKK